MDRLAHFRLFIAVADQGSISRASRSLGMSNSAVSEGLQRLERHVGAQLFLRTTRQLSLTAEGERFLPECRRILSEVEEAISSVGDAGPLKGEIRITATNDFGRTRLEPLLNDFLAQNPEVSALLTLSDDVIDLAGKGYDIGVRTGPLEDSAFVAHLLMRGRRLVYAAPAYWDRIGRPLNPRELTRHNCLVLARPSRPEAVWQFREGNRNLAVRVKGDRSVNDGAILRRWAVAGYGVVLKSEFDVADDVSSGRLEGVLQDYVIGDTNLYAVHPSGRNPSRRVAALIDYLKVNLSGQRGTFSSD